MSKKLAHTIFLIGDIFCIWGLWYGYHAIVDVLADLNSQINTIRFGNRVGLFTTGAMLPIIHMLGIFEHFFSEYVKKYMKVLNIGIIILILFLIFSGSSISSWLKSKVENGGYTYCRNASGVSALSRTLVYTKNMQICEELVASKRKRRK